MEITKYINSYIRFENVICVYRNFSYLNKRAKYLVTLRIFLEIGFVFFAYGYYVRFYFDRFPNDRFNKTTTIMYNFYMFFSTVNTLAAFFLSYYNSHFFKEFISNIDAVHKLFENNKTFQNITKEQYRRGFIDLALYAIGFVILTGFFVMSSVQYWDNIVLVVQFAIELSLELRYYFENVIFNELIKVVIAPLRFLNVSVGMVVEKMKSRYGEDYDDELWGVRRELEKWGVASQHLVTASDRLCDSFGVQVALSFFSAAIYNIIFIYQAISNAVTQTPSSTEYDVATVVYSLTSFVAIIYLTVSSGQRATRKANQLHKNVVVLHTLLVGIPGEEARDCARAAAGLARRLGAAPLRLRLLTALSVQMALLAEILALVANYTIVLLQFNHVV